MSLGFFKSAEAWPYTLKNDQAPATLQNDPALVGLRQDVVDDLLSPYETSTPNYMACEQYIIAASRVIVNLAGEDAKIDLIHAGAVDERRLRDSRLPSKEGHKLHKMHELGLGVVRYGQVYDFAHDEAGYRYERYEYAYGLLAPSNAEIAGLKVAKFILTRDLAASYSVARPDLEVDFETFGAKQMASHT